MNSKSVTENEKSRINPLVVLASTLSTASLTWTTWSLMDLLGVGPIGLTVALTADLIWASVIWCEYKRIGNKWAVKIIGWIAVVIVGLFIAWHGISVGNDSMAVLGPFLTLGTKAVWEMALASMRDEAQERRRAAFKKIALIDVDSEILEQESAAQIRKENAEADAEHERILAEKRRKHELAMADLRHKAEEERAASNNRSDLLIGTLENSQLDQVLAVIERHQSKVGTIAGETVPPVDPPKPPKQIPPPPPFSPKTSLPSGQVKKEAPVTGLTEAQAKKKILAAQYYMVKAEAERRGELISQAEFARRYSTEKNTITNLQVSRAVSAFSPGSMTQEDYEQAMSA